MFKYDFVIYIFVELKGGIMVLGVPLERPSAECRGNGLNSAEYDSGIHHWRFRVLGGDYFLVESYADSELMEEETFTGMGCLAPKEIRFS